MERNGDRDGAKPAFEYPTALLRNYKAAAERPAEWLPWTYRGTLLNAGKL